MKKLVLILSLFISFAAFAQVDSSKLNVTASLQFRDWAYIIGTDAISLQSVTGENLYDQIKTTVRANAGITGTTLVSSDTMDAAVAISISTMLRDKRFSPTYLHWTRINNALRAATGPGAAYLLRRLDILDDADAADDLQRMQRGINRLKGVE